jgi:hypothetical protein
VAAWLKAWVCGSSLAGIVGSNPAGAWSSLYCECCVLSGRGLCVGLVTRPESDSDREASTVRRPWPTRGYCAIKKKVCKQPDQPTCLRTTSFRLSMMAY